MNENIIDSRDIDKSLIDSYWLFDVNELARNAEESEQANFVEEYGCDFGDDFLEIEFDIKEICKFMAEESIEFFEQEIDGLEIRVKEVFSPRFYNFATDSYDLEVVKNPFGSIDELVGEMKKVCLEGEYLNDDYCYHMMEAIEGYLYEHVDGYYVGDYDTMYSFEQIINKFGPTKKDK